MNEITQIQINPIKVRPNKVLGTFKVTPELNWGIQSGEQYILTRWDRTIYLTVNSDGFTIDRELGEKLKYDLDYLVIQVVKTEIDDGGGSSKI